MVGREIGLLALIACAAGGCEDTGSPGADVGAAACSDDYVLLLIGGRDEDGHLVELDDGDDLVIEFLPTGLNAAELAVRTRGIGETGVELTLELLADGATIAELATRAGAEAPLGREWDAWLPFFDFPDAYIGETATLRGRVSDACERVGEAERAVVLVDGR